MAGRALRLLPSLGRGLQRLYSSPAVVVPAPRNEPVLNFEPGSQERADVEKALSDLRNHVEEIPCVIGGREVYTGQTRQQVAPYDHQRVIANFHLANEDMIKEAIDTAMVARKEWDNTPFEHRAAIFLRIADLLSTKYRPEVLATTMVGQAKTVLQAEIDATCELIDFYRFAVHYASELYRVQPEINPPGVWNRVIYRGLEGFVAAISPFNFTAIGGNLSATPTLMGNVSLWKPASTAMLSNWTLFKVFREAGLPDGVINFMPSSGPTFGNVVTGSEHLAAINFTGSDFTFNWLWKHVGQNIENYRTFPRLVGEVGGKNYHFVHPSADVATVVNCTIRGTMEYSGQKCSATARMYVPESLWPEVREGMVEILKEMKVASPEDFSTFTSAVIDEASFDRISTEFLDYARESPEVTTVIGGNGDKSVGYFIEPTIYETSNPKDKLMEEEVFGPVLTVYVYPDRDLEQALHLADTTSRYALTGAVFARDRAFIAKALRILRHSAGNFYINDKSTGSVVGQQPFGGARGSGTNDKAGAGSYLQRWVSPMTIKETALPVTQWGYPSVDQ